MPSASPSARRDRLPARRVPLLYFSLAHLSLAVAFAVVAWAPARVTGFFYHPHMVFVVHLVTLGWITSSILGALYLVAPMALRTPLPAEPADYGAFALYLLGGSGVVFHFWLDELSGVGLSAVLVLLAVGRIGIRLLIAIAGARLPPAVKAHFALAFFNFGLAALWGMLLAFNKWTPFLPGYVMTNVYAHAHLAALGWGVMTVFAAAYRLLPMLLPAAMPEGRRLWTSAALLETGVLGLAVALFLQSSWSRLFALLTVAGIAAFFAQVAWMRRHPRPAPRALRRPDWGVVLALQALGYLALAAVLGLVLAWAPEAEWTLRLAAIYGACGLVGFLAQIVVGVSMRLLPIFAWLRAAADAPPPFTPHDLPARGLQAATCLLWTLGMPVLAVGLALENAVAVGAAAWALLAAVVAGALQGVLVLRRANGGGIEPGQG